MPPELVTFRLTMLAEESVEIVQLLPFAPYEWFLCIMVAFSAGYMMFWYMAHIGGQ